MTCSIITQERLDRITEHVNEMTVNSIDNSESGESLEVSGLSPLNLERRADKIEQNIDFSLPEENSNVRHHPVKPLTSVEEEQSHSKPTIEVGCNGGFKIVAQLRLMTNEKNQILTHSYHIDNKENIRSSYWTHTLLCRDKNMERNT